MNGRNIRVLVVDDSAVVRRMLTESIDKEPDLEVIGQAPDPFVARDRILALKPDVMTLDIEMPRMDGLTFLTKLMHYQPMPVIIISSVGQASCDVAIEALRRGAVEVVPKPSGPYSVGDIGVMLPQKIRAAFGARLARPKQASAAAAPPPPLAARAFGPGALVAIGASTGGTQAIEEVLLHLPAECPPILIAQHLSAGFSASFAARLNSLCRFEVKEAKDGDIVSPGRVLIAPGNFHMMLEVQSGIPRVAVKDGPRVHYQKPAVDVLFRSVAESRLGNAVGVLLTGMGADGAAGLLRMREAGARTIAQDEATSVVFGMPKAAIQMGAAALVLPLSKVAGGILSSLSASKGE